MMSLLPEARTKGGKHVNVCVKNYCKAPQAPHTLNETMEMVGLR